MDKVFSTRLDETVAARISGLARRLHTSKKRVIEEAVALLDSTLGESRAGGFLDQSFGAWQRDESAGNGRGRKGGFPGILRETPPMKALIDADIR